MSPRQAIRFLLHVASRGGNLLLNVGPDAAGNIPPVQRRCLEGMGDWMKAHGSIDGTRRVQALTAKPVGSEGGDEEIGKEWVRWLKRGKEVYAYIDSGDQAGELDGRLADRRPHVGAESTKTHYGRRRWACGYLHASRANARVHHVPAAR
jgi:alpha-L-fucosidase